MKPNTNARITVSKRRRTLAFGLLLLAVVSTLLGTRHADAQAVPVDNQVRITYTGLVFNRSTNTFDTMATLTNTGTTPIFAPMSLVITSIAPASVQLANATGATTAGLPYLSIPLSAGSLNAGATLSSIILKFRDPSRVSFTFTQSILGVVATNHAPVAVADNYSTPEDTTLLVSVPGVLANDTDAQGNPLTAVLVSGPASGTLVLNANGAFTYSPAVEFTGVVTFSYRANNGVLDSNVATVTIDVTPVNEAPVANADSYSTNQNVSLIVAAPGVLGNDTDEEGAGLTAALDSGPASGALAFNANGSFSYAPAFNFFGTVSFTYRASDGNLWSNPATVTVTVLPVNHAPVAADDRYSTGANRALTVAAPGVLANDTDADGTALTALLVTPPAVGTLNLNAGGGFTYTPPLNFAGSVTFTYRASDGINVSNLATVTVTVVSLPPVAANDLYDMLIDTTLTVAAPGVLANDRVGTSGTCLIALLNTPPAVGTLNLSTNGAFTYTPPPLFLGQVTFTYHANDCALNSSLATVTINVLARGTGPGDVSLTAIFHERLAIGRDEQQFSGTGLPRPAPSDIVVTLTSSDPSRLVLAPFASAPLAVVGSATLDVIVPAGETIAPFIVEALADNGTVRVTASAPGYISVTGDFPLHPSGFHMDGADIVGIVLSSDQLDAVPVCFARLVPGTLEWEGVARMRPGALRANIVLTSTNTSVGTIVGSPSYMAVGEFCTGQHFLPNPDTQLYLHRPYLPLVHGTTYINLTQPATYSTPADHTECDDTGVCSGVRQSIRATN